ncbi:hypothetical protein OROGR_033105 [Orobanche gracilis]
MKICGICWVFDKRLFGFDNVISNTNNHIWIFSDKDTNISVLESRDQFLHVSVLHNSSPNPFNLSVVYGKNTKIERRDLWEALLSVRQFHVPWMVGGDFNIVLHPSEKRGDNPPIPSDMEEFRDATLDCGLSDGGYVGSPFTWYSNNIWQRLDRVLFSSEWYNSFPNCVVRHLPRHKSDHNALLCEFNSGGAKQASSFRFQNMWTKHHKFLEVVRESWQIPIPFSGLLKLSKKLQRLKLTLKDWNNCVFGNIFDKVAEARDRVVAAEAIFDGDPSLVNKNNLRSLNDNLIDILTMEEMFWKQKTNMKWILEGERNSKFFHDLIKKKRKTNFIHSMVEDGTVLTEPAAIAGSAVNYFENCFKRDNWEGDRIKVELISKSIDEVDNNTICEIPSLEEIRCVIFEMEKESVAGPDGFSANFFQVCWDILKFDVEEAVTDFFEGAELSKAYASTSISLIPKNLSPAAWKDFRPVSLCNTSYKIISKILSKRLSLIIPRIVSYAQSAFIKDRLITDNVLTALEVVHDISRSSFNTIVKLDMEKAYDRVSGIPMALE